MWRIGGISRASSNATKNNVVRSEMRDGRSRISLRSSGLRPCAGKQIARHPMLTNSRDIKRRLEQEGWVLDRVTGSHHVFKHPQRPATIISMPHPKKDLGRGLLRNIYRQAG